MPLLYLTSHIFTPLFEMKKVGTISAAVLGSVVTAKLYQNHTREHGHKMAEIAKPYLPTLKQGLVEDFSITADRGKKTCVIIGEKHTVR